VSRERTAEVISDKQANRGAPGRIWGTMYTPGLARSMCAYRRMRRVECTKPLPRNGQNTSPTLCRTNHRAADQRTGCTATADKLHHDIARTLAVHLAVQDTQSCCAAPRTPEACREYMATIHGRTRTLSEAHSRDLRPQDTWRRSAGQDALLHETFWDCQRGWRSRAGTGAVRRYAIPR